MTHGEIVKEFRKKFKSPKNTGYRVGKEFLGAVEDFFLKVLHDQQDEYAMLVEDLHDLHKPADSEWNLAIRRAVICLSHYESSK